MLTKKLLGTILLSSTLLIGCGSKETAAPEATTEGFTGTKTMESLYDETGKKGDVVLTEVTFENGTPVDVNIDVRNEDETIKSKESEAGNYVMKAGEANAWHKQIDLLEDFIVENKFDISKVTLSTDAGNTDAVTGVSIKVPTYIAAVDELVTLVKEGKEPETGFTGAKIVETPYDETGKKKDIVVTKVVFNNGTPVNLSVDVRTEDGKMKKEESEAGNYVMKEGEANAWGAQIAMLETFLVENNFDTTKVTLTNEEGNTDAVSGVSIKVGTYVKAIEDVIASVK